MQTSETGKREDVPTEVRLPLFEEGNAPDGILPEGVKRHEGSPSCGESRTISSSERNVPPQNAFSCDFSLQGVLRSDLQTDSQTDSRNDSQTDSRSDSRNDSRPNFRSGSRPGSPCDSCTLKDCPTRGLVTEEMLQEAEGNALSPVQMVVSSAAVFLVPLLCALAGVVFWNQYELFGFSTESGAVLGALVGFIAGMVLIQLSLKVLRLWNGS